MTTDRCTRYVLAAESRHALLNLLASEAAAHEGFRRKYGLEADYTTASYRAGRGERLTREDRDRVASEYRSRLTLEWVTR